VPHLRQQAGTPVTICFFCTTYFISQGLVYTYQALGCTYQSLGYTYQALGYKMYGVEKTVSSASKHKIHKAFKIRLRLFLEDLADYCEWVCRCLRRQFFRDVRKKLLIHNS
ncbi:MAG: hypothetical protein IJE15_08340, partial [Bacteroidaceae bacterium]|nr:hypothetical protein [Bacteroidaceae bacterium]